MNFEGDGLSLNRIRDELVRMEDTIIFSLIERAEFAHNPKIYEAGAFGFQNFEGSFLDYFLFEMESLRSIYLSEIVPRICKPGDDLNYGSSATKDTEALQMLSRRIHFGKFVAEAKFQDPKYHDDYVRLIKAKDTAGIEELLTNKAVEERVLRRLRKKAMIYGQEIEDNNVLLADDKPFKIPLDVFVIPLTKEVEVEYLLMRLNHPDFMPEIKVGELSLF
ncbi:chorismate mutase [Chytridium lagenaria]|nr:chorismate mutase [Chytridium lagenaria]